MIRLLLTLGISLTCISCATVPVQSQIWCNEKHVQNASLGETSGELEALPIRIDQIPVAFKLLSVKNFIRLDLDQVNKLSSFSAFPKGGAYYLLRSGIYARESASLEDIKTNSDRGGTRHFQFRSSDRLLTIFSLQGVKREILYPFPVLARLSFAPSSVQAFCYTHY
jgi:hypothetical protein